MPLNIPSSDGSTSNTTQTVDPLKHAIGEYARLALVGDKDATDPNDDTLDPFVVTVISELAIPRPVLVLTGAGAMGSADLDLFAQAAGLLVAAKFRLSPAWEALFAGDDQDVIEVKIGPVTVKEGRAASGSVLKVGDQVAGWETEAARLLGLISVLRARQTPPPSLFGLAGRRRSLNGRG